MPIVTLFPIARRARLQLPHQEAPPNQRAQEASTIVKGAEISGAHYRSARSLQRRGKGIHSLSSGPTAIGIRFPKILIGNRVMGRPRRIAIRKEDRASRPTAVWFPSCQLHLFRGHRDLIRGGRHRVTAGKVLIIL